MSVCFVSQLSPFVSIGCSIMENAGYLLYICIVIYQAKRVRGSVYGVVGSCQITEDRTSDIQNQHYDECPNSVEPEFPLFCGDLFV